MTLSNFDWTDKDSVKWFLLLPTGHEGPYSLDALTLALEQKKLAPDVKIWCEGLSEGVSLKTALENLEAGEVFPDLNDLPDLPPPVPENEIPPIPSFNPPPLDSLSQEGPEEESEEGAPEEDLSPKQKKNYMLQVWGFLLIILLVMGYLAFGSFLKDQEKIELSRLPKMSPTLFEKIQKENTFSGWDKPVFFKEYLPLDHSHIWLVNTGFQTCAVEASFKSQEGKLLTLTDEEVSFKTKGELKNHIVEFSQFQFEKGNKIVPGMYEMNVKATGCEWEGMLPKIMNRFSPPEETYQSKMKVVLFSKGAQEFNTILERLLEKKKEEELREKNRVDLFWQDLQMKFETLQAITLQIEQLFLDFMENPGRNFKGNLKSMVDQYTRKFGSFLTSFVVENENYFKGLPQDFRGDAQKRNYELKVRLMSKTIGLESMKLIEEWSLLKSAPGSSRLKKYQERIKEVYAELKKKISSEIIQVSQDRSN